MEKADPISDMSRTQRVVLLIDLNPLLHLSDPAPYLTSILSSARTFLSFPSLSLSLFSFKLFFSSLSPLLSSSKLPKSSLSLSFDLPSTTLSSLSLSLSSLPSLRDPALNSPPRASFVASSMRQLVHDYAWDPLIDDPVSNSPLGSVFPSNLVVLLSPVQRSVKWVCDFLSPGDESLRNFDVLRRNLNGVFENVKEAFAGKDIHVSWVDVNCGSGYGGEVGEEDKDGLGFGAFESGIRDLGWGFCSTDSIVLGSAVVPFGLIYPKIMISPRLLSCGKKIRAQLSLDILDVNNKPLECKCCDLEMVDLKIFPRIRNDYVLSIPESVNSLHGDHEQKSTFWEQFSSGTTKIHVKAVRRSKDFINIEGQLPNPVLLCDSSGESGKRRKEKSSQFVVDKVLEKLATETGEFMQTESDPIWQILLSFLYRESYWALVSVSNVNGDSCMAIIKPFTVSSALLSVIDSSYHGQITKPSGLIDSQLDPAMKDGKRRRNKKKSILNAELSWSTFCKAAFEHTEVKLEEAYFERACSSSKKMKFLKCWMKQTQKSSSSSVIRLGDPEQQQDKEERLTEMHEESEQPVSVSVDESLTGASRVQDDVVHGLCSETSEAFFSSLPEKIQLGLESEGVDLGALVERLVKSSIYWLGQKYDTGSEVQGDDSCGKKAAVELIKLLLREPKEMVEKHKHIVREYEIQILFRMAILRSEVGASITESTKSKFLRHICLLLENIQCHLEGGFFGDWSLDDYVGKIIKSRYEDTLGDIVHKIYTKMDLLLFADEEEEHPNPLLNSEESNQSWRDKTTRTHKTVSLSEEGDTRSPFGLRREEHARRSKEAEERRERARRFSSFSSRAPDLQRVWAPKQQKTVKVKKVKPHCQDHRIVSNERVCETPITGTKRSWTQGSSSDSEEQHISRTNSSSSVSRSLFQDNWS